MDETRQEVERSRRFPWTPFDKSLDWLWHAIVDAAEEVEVVVVRADDEHAAGDIMEQIEAEIERADAVIGVCTDKNANVFYELGMARHRHEPILVAPSRADLPFDVGQRRAIFYEGLPLEALRERIGQALRATIDARPPPVGFPNLTLLQFGSIGSSQGVTPTMSIPFSLKNDGSVPADLWWVTIRTPDGTVASIRRDGRGEAINKDSEERYFATWRARDSTDVIPLGPPIALVPNLHVQLSGGVVGVALEYELGAGGSVLNTGEMEVGFASGKAAVEFYDARRSSTAFVRGCHRSKTTNRYVAGASVELLAAQHDRGPAELRDPDLEGGACAGRGPREEDRDASGPAADSGRPRAARFSSRARSIRRAELVAPKLRARDEVSRLAHIGILKWPLMA